MTYDPEFINGETVVFPQLSDRLQAEAFGAGDPVEHSRFSIVMHAARGLAIFTAHTIDGAEMIDEGEIPRKDRFRFDPTIPRAVQTDNDQGYYKNDWDRGHLVRRRSMHWGNLGAAEQADRESYYWSNIAPQHHKLQDKAWGKIEDWMLDHAEGGDRRAIIFTGPVLSPDDPEIINRPGEDPLQIPAGFWKIIAVKPHNKLRAAGFLVWQRDFDHDTPVDFAPYLEQVRITTIEFITGLSFGELRKADPLRFETEAVEPADDEFLDDPGVDFGIPGRGPGEALRPEPATRAVRPMSVHSASDIVI
ncbi:MAG: DNA/RNA non-specific endonuclease [bacterium]|nr:DNA/RNA non-specific endonuclease [bacterium]